MPKTKSKSTTAKKVAPSRPAAAGGVKPNPLVQIGRQALPYLAILLALFLVLGRFNFGGWLPIELYQVFARLTGWVSFTVLPAVIIYLSVLDIKQTAGEQTRATWLTATSSTVFVLSAATILHIAIDSQEALSLAQAGSNGGLIGYGLAWLLLHPLNSITGFLVLIVLNVISLFALLNLTFKRFYEMIGSLFRRDSATKLQPGEHPVLAKQPAGAKAAKKDKFKLHEGVPVGESVTEPVASAPKVKKTPLTVPADPDWRFPALNLLNQQQDKADAGNIQKNAETIRETLANFNIDVEMEGANIGPRVTQYTLKPPSGIKLNKIVSLESNISLDLAASSIRIEAPIPGQRAVGIEVPNKKAATVRISSLFATPTWREARPRSLAFCVGKDISGDPEIAYLEKMPHVLIAGQTGSGKSVGINVLLTSLLYRNSPADLKLILVDPKQVELGPYNDIPHLLTPIITTPEKCIAALKWTVAEMERRLKVFATVSKRNIGEYNQLPDQPLMPFIVVVIDELADLMMVASRDVESLIVRIAQKARAAGIHLVLATQRPSVDVITGLIKANVPARLAFTVASQVDSRTILDQIGAEKLLGSGDMLYLTSSLPKPKRLQGAFMTDEETEKVCDFLRDQRPAQYDAEVISQEVSIASGKAQPVGDGDAADDELYDKAVDVVVEGGKASTSYLQRRLRIGYSRAARLMETLEEQGVIGPADGNRPRPILATGTEEADGDADDMDEMNEAETDSTSMATDEDE